MASFLYYDILNARSYVPPESIFSNFDLVLCRTLLIYFQQNRRTRVFDKLFHALASGGYIAEGMPGQDIPESAESWKNLYIESTGKTTPYPKGKETHVSLQPIHQAPHDTLISPDHHSICRVCHNLHLPDERSQPPHRNAIYPPPAGFQCSPGSQGRGPCHAPVHEGCLHSQNPGGNFHDH